MPHDSHIRATTLKVESRTRIEILPRGGLDEDDRGSEFRKVYRTPRRLAWRTFLLPSRAHREFLALKTATAAGLPCVSPTSWSETRRFACVRTCEVSSTYVAGWSMKAMLEGGTLSSRDRRALCRDAGKLLRSFHDEGMLWMTAMPRNVILAKEGDEPLVACDLPYGLSFRRAITGSSKAHIDLFSMGFSPSRTQELSKSDQRALLLSYCGARREECRELWRAMQVRTPFRQKLARTVMYCGPGLLYPALRRIVPGFRNRAMRA